MFIGHFSVSLLARTAAPAVPLWVFVAATQFLDIIWCIFIMLGFERVEADPGVTEGLRFLFYPYSHSLLAAAFWGVFAALAAKTAMRLNVKDSALLGAVVSSHWLLDLIVHRADLPLWPGGSEKLGLGLWNMPAIELGLEIALFLSAGLLLLKLTRGRRLWPWLAFFAFGAVFMVAMRAAEPAPEIDPVVVGAMGLIAYGTFVALAWLTERLDRRTHRIIVNGATT